MFIKHKIFIILLKYCIIQSVNGLFEIESTSPSQSEDGENIYIERGAMLTLTCTSNEEFNLCQWVRPDSINCGLFNSDQSTSCKNDPRVNGMSDWSIRKEGGRKCILTVEAVRDTEVGDWNCRLESFPNNDGRKVSKSESFSIKILEPAKVTIEGNMELTFRDNTEETAICTASGTPKPVKVEWYLNNEQLETINKETNENAQDNSIEETITAVFPQNSNRLECRATQIDAMNNEIESRDWREVSVRRKQRSVELRNLGRQDDSFTIVNRYPLPSDGGDEASLLLKKGVGVKFFCKSSLRWNVCQWLRPNSGNKPCQSFASSGSTSCDNVWQRNYKPPEYEDDISYQTDDSHWTVTVEDDTTCSISTHAIASTDIGEWNCELQSFPNAEKHYLEDQKRFYVDLINEASIRFEKYPESYSLTEGDKEDFKVNIDGAYPIPTIEWYVGQHKLEDDEIEIIHDGTPQNHRSRRAAPINTPASYYQEIRYTAQLDHTGQQLACKIIQTDEEGNALEQTHPVTTLFVAAPIVVPPKTLGTGIIAVIISIACFILLVLILLFVAFRTGRFCFKNATHTIIEKEVEAPRPDQNSMECQANFGPDKPERMGSREEIDNISAENVPLIARGKTQGKAITVMTSNDGNNGNEDEMDEQSKKLEAMLSDDELKKYEFEGNESICTSLSSLDTNVPDEDWRETFRAMGPKFHRLADIIGESGDESSSTDDETEIKAVQKHIPNGTPLGTMTNYKQTISSSVTTSRKFIQTVNIKQTSSSIQHHRNDSQTTDSGMSNTPSSAINGGNEDSSDGTEI